MTYLRAKSSSSQSFSSKLWAANALPSTALPSTGSALLDTLCDPLPKPAHKTLFEQVSANGLGLQNIEIPQLASQPARLAVQKSSQKKTEQNDESLSDRPLPSSRATALERIHRTVQMDRAKVDNVRSNAARLNKAAS